MIGTLPFFSTFTQGYTFLGNFPFAFLADEDIPKGGLTGGFLLLQNFSVAISVSPHVCFILVLILISMFLR